MDKKQEAVTQPAEQTAPTESAPVETKDDGSLPQEEPQEESPVESIQPEKKTSESVPYDRFSEVNSEKQRLAEENAWLKSQMAPASAVGAPEIPILDSDSDFAVREAARQEFRQELEADKVREFISRHPELKEDKVLSGTLKSIFEDANRRRMVDPTVPFLNHEEALTQAQKLLEEKIKPVQKEASQEGFKEGQDIARKKEQLGDVGSSNYREPEVDDKDLTAAEIAKKYNIPRI